MKNYCLVRRPGCLRDNQQKLVGFENLDWTDFPILLFNAKTAFFPDPEPIIAKFTEQILSSEMYQSKA